ncbi:MAG: pyridoxamine 5'-phosphate oxidase [Planctomycetota bacterium]|nr:MAG: pyridoxamine 5'-phosphate oxidase [Planctomycetota bacterium]
MSLADMRRDYARSALHESAAGLDPFALFHAWFRDAQESSGEANACVLATVDGHSRPAARVVLCKGIEDGAFRFFTNLDSRKARDIARHPGVALCFHWQELERQVRIEGRAELLPRSVVERYFRSRPRTSQLGAWASPQSRIIPSRDVLEDAFGSLEVVHARGEVPVPPHWGGFAVIPELIEFWQGRPSRLHDRLCYCRDAAEACGWRRERLAP